MPAYLIIQIRFRADRGAFAPYRDAVGPLAEKFGGRYIVAGGAKVEPLEGTHDGRSLVMFEFPSMDALHGFLELAPLRGRQEVTRGAGRFGRLGGAGLSAGCRFRTCLRGAAPAACGRARRLAGRQHATPLRGDAARSGRRQAIARSRRAATWPLRSPLDPLAAPGV